MSLIVVTAGILGMIAGEWKHSGTTPLTLQALGMHLRVLAVITLSRAQSHSNHAVHPGRASLSMLEAGMNGSEAFLLDALNVR